VYIYAKAVHKDRLMETHLGLWMTAINILYTRLCIAILMMKLNLELQLYSDETFLRKLNASHCHNTIG